jgi:hypothetical protein
MAFRMEEEKTMKGKLMTSAAAIALLGAFGHFAAKPLLAQIRAVLVKNIDERGRAPYMVQATCGAIANSKQCEADFAVVPANKRFVVEYVNGLVSGAHGNFQGAFLNVPSAGQSQLPLLAHFDVTDASGRDQYTISMPAVFYYEPGQTPFVVLVAVTAPGLLGGSFTLSGYLVDLTQ